MRSMQYGRVLQQLEKKGDARILEAVMRASGLTKTSLQDEAVTREALAAP